jgi:hypothetical protein
MVEEPAVELMEESEEESEDEEEEEEESEEEEDCMACPADTDESDDDDADESGGDDLASLLHARREKAAACEAMRARVAEEMAARMDTGVRVNPLVAAACGVALPAEQQQSAAPQPPSEDEPRRSARSRR